MTVFDYQKCYSAHPSSLVLHCLAVASFIPTCSTPRFPTPSFTTLSTPSNPPQHLPPSLITISLSTHLRRRSRPNNLPPRPPHTQPRPTPVLVIPAHVTILMHIPALPRPAPLLAISRRRLCLLL